MGDPLFMSSRTDVLEGKCDNDGQTRGARQAWERELRAVGLAIHEIQQWAPGGHREGLELKQVTMLLDRDSGTSTLLVVKAESAAGAIVGFVGGYRLSETVLALGDKLRAGAIKWREDRPWDGAKGE